MDISTISYEVSVAKFSLVHRVSQICTIMTGCKIDVIDVTHPYIIYQSQVKEELQYKNRGEKERLQYIYKYRGWKKRIHYKYKQRLM